VVKELLQVSPAKITYNISYVNELRLRVRELTPMTFAQHCKLFCNTVRVSSAFFFCFSLVFRVSEFRNHHLMGVARMYCPECIRIL